MTVSPFLSLNLRFTNVKSLLWITAFVAGNLLFPALCHSVPGNAGLVLLPIYFFTLIAAYKFGWRVGLATAVLSPLVNSLIWGMPLMVAMPVILTKSVLLASFATLVARRTNKVSILHLLAVVAAYQVAGSGVEMLLTQSVAAGLADFQFGVPGMLLQVVGGYLVLKVLAKSQYE
jgi:hypothetical protein